MQVSPIVAHLMASALRAESHGDPSTVMQMHTLRVLSNGPLTLKQLAATRPVSLPTLSRSVDAMVRKSWLERVPHPHDRRQVLLRLTDAGRAEFERLRELVIGKMAHLFSLLSEEDRQTLDRALGIIERMTCDPDFHNSLNSDIPALRSSTQPKRRQQNGGNTHERTTRKA